MGEKVYGLLGRKLGHSWSAPIHAALGCADYCLIELEPEELGAFLAREDIGGLNVTIPYKRDVMAYCDVLDPMAEAIGIVNTLVRRADGKLYGYNTDAAGFWDAQGNSVERQLTQHVVTRWYRAPEVLVMEVDAFGMARVSVTDCLDTVIFSKNLFSVLCCCVCSKTQKSIHKTCLLRICGDRWGLWPTRSWPSSEMA